MFSQEYLSAVVIILVAVLPKLGIQVGSEELTGFLQAVITVVGGIVIMVRRFKKGDISVLGAKKV